MKFASSVTRLVVSELLKERIFEEEIKFLIFMSRVICGNQANYYFHFVVFNINAQIK